MNHQVEKRDSSSVLYLNSSFHDDTHPDDIVQNCDTYFTGCIEMVRFSFIAIIKYCSWDIVSSQHMMITIVSIIFIYHHTIIFIIMYIVIVYSPIT